MELNKMENHPWLEDGQPSIYLLGISYDNLKENNNVYNYLSYHKPEAGSQVIIKDRLNTGTLLHLVKVISIVKLDKYFKPRMPYNEPLEMLPWVFFTIDIKDIENSLKFYEERRNKILEEHKQKHILKAKQAARINLIEEIIKNLDTLDRAGVLAIIDHIEWLTKNKFHK